MAQQRKSNVHIDDEISEAQFARYRQARDATLAAPKLLFPPVQLNMRAGYPPAAEANGQSYLKIPLRRG